MLGTLNTLERTQLEVELLDEPLYEPPYGRIRYMDLRLFYGL
jgi:hypothetical protein